MTRTGEVTREILGNIPAPVQTWFYIISLTACSIAVFFFLRRFSAYRPDGPKETAGGAVARATGRGPGPSRSIAAGVGSVVSYLTFHRQLLRDRYAGVAHLLTFYGFFILFIGTCLVFLEHDTPLHFFYGRFYLGASLVIDLGGAAFLIGLTMFLARRVGGVRRTLDAWWVVALAWLLLAIGVSGFLLEGARIARDMPGFERWSIVGYGIALGLRGLGFGGETALTIHRAVWLTHAVFCIALFVLLPWRFFGHIVYGAVSWATRGAKRYGTLRPPAVGTSPGAVTVRDLPWRDLLQTDACTTCGRCNEVCPAHAAGKNLRPREVVLALRAAFDARSNPAQNPVPEDDNGGASGRAGATPLTDFIADETLWSCTTCAACNEACPVGIDVFDKIVEVRRGRVETGVVPPSAEQLFENTAALSNPYGGAVEDRLAWADGLEVPVAREGEPIELLYWVGCAGSFDPDGRTVTRSMVRILNHLRINYRILGRRECCTGDPARRMGEEGLFRRMAINNIGILRSHRVTRVVTHCPHCFNTFRNEYPEMGASFEVEHHSQFLHRMIREGRLRLPAGPSGTITFHDPCYLGRGNGETSAPREVLRALPGVSIKEMPRSGLRSFCCGAGGGAMWLDQPGVDRVENIRAREAAGTGAGTIATGCPFCKTMLEAGRASLESGGAGLAVKDLAELVVEAEGL